MILLSTIPFLFTSYWTRGTYGAGGSLSSVLFMNIVLLLRLNTYTSDQVYSFFLAWE